MPSSVTQQSQMIPGTMNSNQPSVSQPHVGSHAGPANNSLYNQNNQMGMRPPAQSLQSTNSVQQNGVWQNHSTSIQPDSLNMQRPLDGVSGQHSTVTSPINTNQNTTNHTTASSNLQNLIPQSNTPQANLQSPLRGQSFMTTSSISPVSRPTNPNMLPNVLAPPNNIHGPRQTSSSIRQRYPNMMPPPMSTNQQPTMQTNLPPMSTSSLPQQNFGQSPPSGYPPIIVGTKLYSIIINTSRISSCAYIQSNNWRQAKSCYAPINVSYVLNITKNRRLIIESRRRSN